MPIYDVDIKITKQETWQIEAANEESARETYFEGKQINQTDYDENIEIISVTIKQ